MHMPAGQKKLLMHAKSNIKSFMDIHFLYHSDSWFLLFPLIMKN